MPIIILQNNIDFKIFIKRTISKVQKVFEKVYRDTCR